MRTRLLEGTWSSPVALLLVCALGVTGCEGCGREKPYTPFGVASSMPLVPPSTTPEPSASAAQPPKFAPKKAELAPPGAATWTIGDLKLEAPPGRVFQQAVRADFGGDEQLETLAWTLPAAPPGTPAPTGSGELWLFPSSGAPARIFEQPGFIPIGPQCKHATALAQTGAHTVTLDVTASCTVELVSRSPVRGIAVLAPLAEQPLILLLRAAAAAPGETLGLSVDSSDRDGDGRDDARVTVTVQSTGSARPANADVVWLDRAAGRSRDAQEPARSLARGASIEAVRAKGKTTNKTVSDAAGNLRRLYAALCAEAGVPRLFDADGAPLRCGELRGFVDDLAMAEMTAALTRKDFVEAAATLSRDGWYHAPMSADRRARVIKAFEAVVPRVRIENVTTLTARVARRGTTPRWSPLRFDDAGALLVQAGPALVRVTPDAEERALADDAGVARWPLEVTSDERIRWTGVVLPCDRAEVQLTMASSAGAAVPVVTRMLAPRPGACRGGAGTAPSLTAVSWQNGRLEALISGSPVGPTISRGEAVLRPPQPGSPRSPDGRAMIVATPLGLLVAHEQGAELWQGEFLGEARTLGDCVITNDRQRAACVRDDRVLLVTTGSPR